MNGRKFANPFNRVCTMLNNGKFSPFLRNGLWAQATNTATLLENNPNTPMKGLSPFQQAFEKEKRKVLT